MSVLWVQQDAPDLMRKQLRKAMPGWEERVVAFLPDKWVPSKGAYVTVVSDGTPVDGGAWTRELVRVVVRSDNINYSRRIMSEIDAYLRTPGLRGFGLGVRPATGIIALPDSKQGGFMASATYGVTLPKTVKGRI